MNMKPIDTDLLRDLWFDSDVAITDMCVRLGVSSDTIYKNAKQMGLPRRPRAERISDKDPTAEEIAERSATIREGWSESEKERRRVGGRRQEWTPPHFVHSGRQLLFWN